MKRLGNLNPHWEPTQPTRIILFSKASVEIIIMSYVWEHWYWINRSGCSIKEWNKKCSKAYTDYKVTKSNAKK